MTERNQIEIDYCPSCRGVWLDKGELDKMLAYADLNITKNSDGDNRSEPGNRSGYDPGLNRPYRQHEHYQHQKPYKKKSFLKDLFDFD